MSIEVANESGVAVDESALAFETIFVSAGRRGLELELAPGDLLAVTGGRTAAVASRR